MLKSKSNLNAKSSRTGRPNLKKNHSSQPNKIASIGKVSENIINELYSPLDAINRFINLALQSLEENSQSRQFLLESKKGVRKTSFLLKRLDNCVRKIEEEINHLEGEVGVNQ
ncbi:hypothetical protein ACFL1I_07075 [Candidatus Omnitrophota bacterium]